MLIMYKEQKNFKVKMRQRGLINMQAKEQFISRHFRLRCIMISRMFLSLMQISACCGKDALRCISFKHSAPSLYSSLLLQMSPQNRWQSILNYFEAKPVWFRPKQSVLLILFHSLFVSCHLCTSASKRFFRMSYLRIFLRSPFKFRCNMEIFLTN
mgnify:FL=1